MRGVLTPAPKPAPSAPTVSVVMSVYNGACFLRQAVESILAQTLADLEFIIVDDASTDDTPRILDSIRDPRILRLANGRNLGLTRSLNRALRASSGHYIARQDADDWSFPERLERQVAHLEGNPRIGLVGTASRWIDAAGAAVRDWYPETDPMRIQTMLLHSIPFLHGTFLFRSACLADLDGGYDESIPVAQDCDLLLRLSESWDLANLPAVLYVHRVHEEAVTSRRSGEQKHYLMVAQQAAVRRRLAGGRARLGLRLRRAVPAWARSSSRRRLSQRFAWWATAAKRFDGRLALQFLLIAFLLDPIAPDAWSYVRRGVKHRLAPCRHRGRPQVERRA